MTDRLSEQLERMIGKDPRVLGTFEYRHILSEVHALEAENTKLKNECDSISAKTFEMAAQEIDDEIYMRENNKDRAGNLLYEDYMRPLDEIAAAIRVKSPASVRRQLQLDLINRAIEEAEWWEDYSRSQGFRCIRWERPGAECAHKSCLRLASLKSQRTQLESEIAALEAT